ncbi:MAG: CHASE4 domain-containing protein [Woeseiaceae bacterium]
MSNGLQAWSLQKKVSVTLAAVMSTLVLLTYVILNSIVGPAFDRLEINDAERNLVRAERAIRSDLDMLDAIVRDWASWDDAYNYARGADPEFRKSNLERPTLTNLNLDLLMVLDADGRELWGEVLHEDRVLAPSTLGIFDDGERSKPLMRHTRLDGFTRGLVNTNIGPMMISSRPILTSLDEGPIAGTMIMAQLLDDDRLASLRERTEVSMDWRPADTDRVRELQLYAALNADAPGTMNHESAQQTITSSGVLNDLYGQPLLLLEVTMPRNVSALGSNTVSGALLFLTLAGGVVAVVTWLLLRSIIVLPLEGLARHIKRIRESGDLTQKLNAARGDEIGSLAAEFDQMTGELHDARRLLLDQSFKAGKADTAAEVLHNIRNAMTPLINGIDRLGKYFKVANTLRISQVTSELRDPEGDASRREKLLQYVDSAFDHIKATGKEAGDDLHVISRQARQVEAILSDQERHAKVPPVMEDLDVAELLDEAVLVVPKSDQPVVEIALSRPATACRVKGHRVGLMQVLGNVILNAYESIKRCPPGNGRIELSAQADMLGEQPMIRVTVRDSGCGFDAQTGKKLFQRGFSSKTGHMSGLGLHWCANALAGMGGRILAESTGPGKGAEFHVLLPASQGG